MQGAAVLLLAALAAPLGAQGVTGTLTTIDGRTHAGTVTVAADRVTVRGAGEPIALGLDEVAAVVADGVVADPVATPHRVWLRSGLELGALALRGVPASAGRPAQLAVELPVGVAIEVPLGALRALRFGGAERQQPASFGADLRDPADNTDMLWVQRDGRQHRFQVTVNGMGADALAFDLRGKQHEFALGGVVAVVFGNNTGFAPDRQPPPRVAVDFASGDHLEGRLLALDETLRLRLDEGCETAVPAARIVRLGVASDRVRWLADLEPEVEQTPAFDRLWPYTRDGSVAGPGFVIAGARWTRGIGMVPRTRLTYDLRGDYEQFRAMVGIDDRAGPQAHALFRVYLDDKLVWESAPQTRGMAATALELPLRGCKRLALEVDFGKNFDLGDYCAFADARVLR
jgi:hypothetical protein